MAEKALGDFEIPLQKFNDVDLSRFTTKEFNQLNAYDKHDLVSRYLTERIQATERPCFLLSAVIDYISQIKEAGIIERYNFRSFELWLNQFSDLSPEENLDIRASIMGKRLPRETYQVFFPIGMNKTFEGTHFVTAHASPDLDTTVASFWGWVDAFAARVGTGLHIWNVPGGKPTAGVEIDLLFRERFGDDVFPILAKTGLSLTLSSYDLMHQQGIMKKQLSEPALSLDHERNVNAVILVDEKGYYIGDWRNIDVEGVRQVIILLTTCLKWFESNLHVRLISLFAKSDLTLAEVPDFMAQVSETKIQDCAPAKEFAPKQKQYLQDYLHKVLGIEEGLDANFQRLGQALEASHITSFSGFKEAIKELVHGELFDREGRLKEDRPLIFTCLEKLVKALEGIMDSVQVYVERLAMAFQIKTDVFGFKPSYLSHRADLEEIKVKMASYPYLTVNYLDDEGRHVPVGIVRSTTLQKPTLGTVTLRDFSNREETGIPPYLEVISVIDHHKITLETQRPPMLLVCDAQSSNALVAELAFSINDQYSAGGMSLEEIEAQLQTLAKTEQSPATLRMQRRLLQKKMVALSKTDHYIDTSREALEYLHFLYAILDDTDLLTKISDRDVVVVAALLNRLKSIFLRQETETVHFDDLSREHENYTKACARRLLTNPDLYSLYNRVYTLRAFHLDSEIALLAKGKPSILFEDTKIQNNCARVGQLKIFAKNYDTLAKHISTLQKIWVENAQAVYKEHSAIPLHMQMISTIASAEELYSGSDVTYQHQDEMWIWIPETELAVSYLKSFLNAFRSTPAAGHVQEIEFCGPSKKRLSQIFKESFREVAYRMSERPLSVAILRYTAGTMNSRKAMITPYLPKPNF